MRGRSTHAWRRCREPPGSAGPGGVAFEGERVCRGSAGAQPEAGPACGRCDAREDAGSRDAAGQEHGRQEPGRGGHGAAGFGAARRGRPLDCGAPGAAAGAAATRSQPARACAGNSGSRAPAKHGGGAHDGGPRGDERRGRAALCVAHQTADAGRRRDRPGGGHWRRARGASTVRAAASRQVNRPARCRGPQRQRAGRRQDRDDRRGRGSIHGQQCRCPAALGPRRFRGSAGIDPSQQTRGGGTGYSNVCTHSSPGPTGGNAHPGQRIRCTRSRHQSGRRACQHEGLHSQQSD